MPFRHVAPAFQPEQLANLTEAFNLAWPQIMLANRAAPDIELDRLRQRLANFIVACASRASPHRPSIAFNIPLTAREGEKKGIGQVKRMEPPLLHVTRPAHRSWPLAHLASLSFIVAGAYCPLAPMRPAARPIRLCHGLG